jgi:hypothetical protein
MLHKRANQIRTRITQIERELDNDHDGQPTAPLTRELEDLRNELAFIEADIPRRTNGRFLEGQNPHNTTPAGALVSKMLDA